MKAMMMLAGSALVLALATGTLAQGIEVPRIPIDPPNPPIATGSVFTIEYAVKFVCADLEEDLFSQFPGVVSEMPVVRGRYLTAINVRNPTSEDVTFTKTLAIAKSREPGPVTSLGSQSLGPGQAIEVDCVDIRGEPDSSEFPLRVDKGFLVIKSPVELDVVAVYTARSRAGQVSTLQVETIEPR